jgi:hypothetical protein
MCDWQAAFQMEKHQVAERFVCFHSARTFAQDTLGLPLSFSINPVKRKVDYIKPSLYLLSKASFDGGVTQAPDGETFDLFLPLYFSPGHFKRALPQIQETLRKLSPEYGLSRSFQPDMVLTVLPKIINTFVVLLADKGITAGKRVLQAYMWVHRLFLALVAHFPKLQQHVEERIDAFVSHRQNRHKNELPSLGDFLPLLLVSNAFSWRDVAVPYFTESLTRNVIWNCKKFPELARVHGQHETDDERIQKTFEGCQISLRLMLSTSISCAYSAIGRGRWSTVRGTMTCLRRRQIWRPSLTQASQPRQCKRRVAGCWR